MRRKRERVRNPLLRILLGGLIMVGAFVLLWRNEGRINLAQVARRAVPVDAAVVDPTLDGEFVMVTGRLETAVPVTDDRYLRRAEFVQLHRQVEMYAWEEERESGRGDEEPAYRYELVWTDAPESAETFAQPQGHVNPPLPVAAETFIAAAAIVGAYRIDPAQIELPTAEPLDLSYDNVREGRYQVGPEYIFAGEGSLETPQPGDVRISYTAVPAGITVTAIGRQAGDAIGPYDYRGRATLHRVLAGDRTTALARLNSEFKFALWGFRVGGFLIMWLGVGLMLSPVTRLFRFMPVLGNLSRGAVRWVSFGVAAVLSLVTISVSALFHNVWALLTLAILAGVGLYWWRQNQGKREKMAGSE